MTSLQMVELFDQWRSAFHFSVQQFRSWIWMNLPFRPSVCWPWLDSRYRPTKKSQRIKSQNLADQLISDSFPIHFGNLVAGVVIVSLFWDNFRICFAYYKGMMINNMINLQKSCNYILDTWSRYKVLLLQPHKT